MLNAKQVPENQMSTHSCVLPLTLCACSLRNSIFNTKKVLRINPEWGSHYEREVHIFEYFRNEKSFFIIF